MIKFVLLCAFASVAVCQEAPINLIPMISNLCNSGGPAICQVMSTFCVDAPVGPTCADIRADCDAASTETCTCVDTCGTNCDAFETNCQNFDIPLVAGIFCPVSGGVCDVTCVMTCPQRAMLTQFQRVAARVGTTVQGLVGMVMANLPQIAAARK